MRTIQKRNNFFKYIITFACIIAVMAGLYFVFFIYGDTTYTVQYNAMGGVCEVIEIEVDKDGTINLPTPSKEGYDFGGWFVDGEKWTNDTIVTSDVRLVAKWIPKKFNITFIVDGEPFSEQCDYGKLPTFTGSTDKTSTNTTEYVFNGWVPELVSVVGEATYTAMFSQQERKYNVGIISNIENAGTFSGEGEYSYNTNVSVGVSVNNGYNFLGWYINNNTELYSTNLNINVVTAKDVTLYARFELKLAQIAYYNTKDCENNNVTSFTINDGDITLINLNKTGYNFLGWFTKATGGVKVDVIDTSLCSDRNLYARWELIEFTINYILNGGTNNVNNPTYYTIEDNIQILKPTKPSCEFKGWSINGGNDIVATYTITTGSHGDLTLSAKWDGEVNTITLMVDGMNLELDTINVKSGTIPTKPTVDSVDYNMLGYSIDGWYTSQSLITKYDFTKAVYEDLTVYGTWKYILEQGFYPYAVKFAGASTSTQTEIDSYNELVAYAEYVKYYDITDKNLIKLTYTSLTGDALFDELEKAIIATTCNSSAVMGYTRYSTASVASIYVLSSFRSVEATLTADEEREYTSVQQDYAYESKITPTRNNSFNNFAINNVSRTLQVTTSDQLVYALEKGLRPVCVAGSKAEKMYNLAKGVLRNIISDDMDTITKVKAIYDWLVLNVEYDNLAADDSQIASVWKKYDAWYLEGVFNNHKAVCDGIAKAFIVLCQIENIPAIRVDGNSHAWNKVYIDGKWYGVDATHGNLQVNGEYEIITYTGFLFTDAYKISKGYTTTDYAEVVADTIFDYYDYATYKNNNTEFDLKIDSLNEFCNLLEYTENYVYTSRYYTIEFVLNFSYDFDALLMYGQYSTDVNIVMTMSSLSDSLSRRVYVLFVQ